MKLNRKKILHALIDAGMNNKELSEVSGVSPSRTSMILNGQNTTYETACKIAKALNVPVVSLIEDQE